MPKRSKPSRPKAGAAAPPQPASLPLPALAAAAGAALVAVGAAAWLLLRAPPECLFFCCGGHLSAANSSAGGWPCRDDSAADATLQRAEHVLGLDAALGSQVGAHGRAGCNLEIVEADAESWPQIVKKYGGASGPPVIVRPRPDSLLFDLPPELTDRAALIEAYGREELLLRDSGPITTMYGFDSGVPASRTTFAEALEQLEANQGKTEPDSADSIDRGIGPFQDIFSLLSTGMHKLFPSLLYFQPSVALGLQGTGLYALCRPFLSLQLTVQAVARTFHHGHGTAVIGVVHGQKRWYFFPPEQTPPREMQWGMTWQWLSQAAAGAFKAAPPTYACTQRAGEVMVVPRVWWHATLNGPGTTFALGAQEAMADIDIDTTLESINPLLAAKDYKGAETRARSLLEHNGAELPVVGTLAQLLVLQGQMKEAQQLVSSAIADVRRCDSSPGTAYPQR